MFISSTFYPFIKDDVALYGVEAAGQGEDTDKHALAIGKGFLVPCNTPGDPLPIASACLSVSSP
jgi:hypothetical protein